MLCKPSNILSMSFLYVIAFACICRGINAAPLGENAPDLEDFEQNSYPDAYREDELEAAFQNYDYSERKFKRQASNVNRQRMEDAISKLSFPSHKAKEILKMLSRPSKTEFVKLNGWSASGMPFNVLYSPNNLQQRLLSSTNNAPAKKPISTPSSQPLIRDNYFSEARENREQNLRNLATKTSARPSQMRKHYLVIPQLFVSYGWGPLGK